MFIYGFNGASSTSAIGFYTAGREDCGGGGKGELGGFGCNEVALLADSGGTGGFFPGGARELTCLGLG